MASDKGTSRKLILGSKSKISNPKRIERILERMNDAKMSVIMKDSSEAEIGIRGAFDLVRYDTEQPHLIIGKVSAKGLQRVSKVSKLKIEVLGMPSRVVFVAKILKHLMNGLVLGIPKTIVSIERRQNTRYATTWNYMSYFRLDDWTPVPDDISGPPVLSPFEDLSGWFGVADVSLGGICVLSHFYTLSKIVSEVGGSVKGQLLFPMMEPISGEFAIRWQKKTVNRISEGGRERARLEYRFGIEFSEMDEAAIIKIRQFMRQLSMANAI